MRSYDTLWGGRESWWADHEKKPASSDDNEFVEAT